MAEQSITVPSPNAAAIDLVKISPGTVPVLDVARELITAHQPLELTDDLTVGGNLQVAGDVGADGDLDVLGEVSIGGDVLDMQSPSGGWRTELTDGDGRVNLLWNAERSDLLTFRYVVAGEDANRVRFHTNGSISTWWAPGFGKLAGDPITWLPLLSHTSTTLTFNGISGNSVQSVVLIPAATSLAIAADTVIVTGAVGGNLLSRITGGATGQTAVVIFVDDLVGIVNNGTHALDTIELDENENAGKGELRTVTLEFDGTAWFETSRTRWPVASVVVLLRTTQTLAYGARFNGVGLFAIANGIATSNDESSGSKTEQPAMTGSIKKIRYATQTGSVTTQMTIYVNGAAAASFSLVGIRGPADVDVPVLDGDVIELSWTAGTAPGRSTWSMIVEVLE